MSLRRSILTTSAGNLVPPVFALMTQPLLAQGLGVDGRGAASAGIAPLMVAVSLCSLGLPESLNRFIAAKTLSLRKASLVSGLLVIVGIAATGTIWVAAGPLSGGNHQALTAIEIGSLFVAPALLFQGLRGVAAGMSLWTSIAVGRCSQSVLLFLLVTGYFLTETLTVERAVAALALGQCAGVIVLALAILKRRGSYSPADQVISNQKFFGYGLYIWIGAASGFLLTRLDQLLMTPLSGVEQLGLYAVAVSISEVVLVINMGLREVIFSAESAGRDPARVGSVTRISNVVVTLLAVVAGLATPVLIAPIFGQEFVPAIPMVLILLLSAVLGNPGSVSGMALAAWGSPGVRSSSIFVALVVNVIAVGALVPAFGGTGAALATLAGNATAMLMVLLAMKRIYKVSPREFVGFTKADCRRALQLMRRSE